MINPVLLNVGALAQFMLMPVAQPKLMPVAQPKLMPWLAFRRVVVRGLVLVWGGWVRWVVVGVCRPVRWGWSG
jgi:hypothetical protein